MGVFFFPGCLQAWVQMWKLQLIFIHLSTHCHLIKMSLLIKKNTYSSNIDQLLFLLCSKHIYVWWNFFFVLLNFLPYLNFTGDSLLFYMTKVPTWQAKARKNNNFAAATCDSSIQVILPLVQIYSAPWPSLDKHWFQGCDFQVPTVFGLDACGDTNTSRSAEL